MHIASVGKIPHWEDMFSGMAGGGMTATQAVYQLYFGNTLAPPSTRRSNVGRPWAPEF